MQKVQSTVIRNGNELENIVKEKSVLVDDLLEFINDVNAKNITEGVFLCPKNAKNRRLFVPKGHDPDLLIFRLTINPNDCFIVELKDGDQFDTKKSDGEKASLIECRDFIKDKIPFVSDYYVCCFNQLDREAIVAGFKNRFDISHVLTGRELCEILQISYDNIIENRKLDAFENVDYFVCELLKSPLIKTKIGMERNLHISEPDFYNTDEE